GIDAGRQILRHSPSTRPILLTMFCERHHVLAALRAGITGYLLKNHAVEDLETAIREVCQGGVYLSRGISRDVLQDFLSNRETPEDPLRAGEHGGLQLVAEGRTTREVAAMLGVSVKTADSHRSRIMEKLDIHETAGLVRYAIRHG